MPGKLSRFLTLLWRRSKLKNHTFSIISNTCIGGVITNSVGEQFRSPTVNLVIYEEEFLTFCEHLADYAHCPLVPADPELEARMGYPVGRLLGQGAGLPDLTVYFVHYKTFDEARDAWHKRFDRVCYEDLFLLMDRGMDATEDILDRFHRLPHPHKVFFTHREDPARWPCTFRLSYYTPDSYRTAYMYEFRRKGLLYYRILDEFDFVHWLNTGIIRRSSIFPATKEAQS